MKALWRCSAATRDSSRPLEVVRSYILFWLGMTDRAEHSGQADGATRNAAVWHQRAVLGVAGSGSTLVLAVGLFFLQGMVAYQVLIKGGYEGAP
jgi:hypothetical protein